jgi:hypothetical protein
MFVDACRQIRQSNLDIVISSEFFTMPYGKCQDVRPFIEVMISHLDGVSLDIELIFACRDHFSWASSIYNQRVKSMNSLQRELRAPDDFLRGIAPQLRYKRILTTLREAGVKVTAINYHPEHDWLHRFLEYVGFPRDRIPERPRRNESLSRAALIAKLAANHAIKDESRIRGFLAGLKNMRKPQGESASIFGPKAIAEAERHFCGDRQFVFDELGIQLPAPLHSARGRVSLSSNEFGEIVSLAIPLGPERDLIVGLSENYLETGKQQNVT